MTKDILLKHIAETAYNVGFGAKKHFATYDIVAKAPGLISFFSLAFGVYALVFDALNAKWLSATIIVLGVVVLYISFYDPKKSEYMESGQKLTDIFNELKRLYGVVKAAEGSVEEHSERLEKLEIEYTKISNTHQILFSNWYAHYKFFWEHQIGWVDEQLKFRLFRDKIPLSLTVAILFGVLLVIMFRFDLFHLCGSIAVQP